MACLRFAWIITPEINARVVGVMDSDALLRVGFGIFQNGWARFHINMVVITLFSILATRADSLLPYTFPGAPWHNRTFWLIM